MTQGSGTELRGPIPRPQPPPAEGRVLWKYSTCSQREDSKQNTRCKGESGERNKTDMLKKSQKEPEPASQNHRSLLLRRHCWYECWVISLLLDEQSDMCPEWHSNSLLFLTGWWCKYSNDALNNNNKNHSSFRYLFVPKLSFYCLSCLVMTPEEEEFEYIVLLTYIIQLS